MYRTPADTTPFLPRYAPYERETPQGFSVALACEKHGLKPEELAQALKVLEVPRIVERQGQKFGYWN